MKNFDVVKSFINGNKGTGSNLKSNGIELMNYRTVIAKNEGHFVILNNTKYSQTTSTIQNMIRRECQKQRITIIETQNLQSYNIKVA